LTGAEETIEPN